MEKQLCVFILSRKLANVLLAIFAGDCIYLMALGIKIQLLRVQWNIKFLVSKLQSFSTVYGKSLYIILVKILDNSYK